MPNNEESYCYAKKSHQTLNHDMLFNKKGVDWTSPSFLVVIILAILLGLFLLGVILRLKKIIP